MNSITKKIAHSSFLTIKAGVFTCYYCNYILYGYEINLNIDYTIHISIVADQIYTAFITLLGTVYPYKKNDLHFKALSE